LLAHSAPRPVLGWRHRECLAHVPAASIRPSRKRAVNEEHACVRPRAIEAHDDEVVAPRLRQRPIAEELRAAASADVRVPDVELVLQEATWDELLLLVGTCLGCP
jgi:hypothetical protein